MSMKFIIRKKGFTLIELLVVISIISLLTSIVMVGLSEAKMKARDSAKIQTIRQIQNALAMYYQDNNTYPRNPQGSFNTVTREIYSNSK